MGIVRRPWGDLRWWLGGGKEVKERKKAVERKEREVRNTEKKAAIQDGRERALDRRECDLEERS